MFRQSHPTLLIIGDYKESITVVRSLGRAGYKLIVGKPAGQKITFAGHSRYTSEVWMHPSFQREEQFVPALLTFLQSRQDIQYVLPLGDTPISILARHHCELPKFPDFLMPSPEVIIRCQDKIRMYNYAVSLGIPTAPNVAVWHPQDLQAAGERVGFPCVIKPRYSPRQFMEAEKALICNCFADFSEWSGFLPKFCPLIVQKFVEGNRRTCYFVAKNSHLLAYFEHQPLRTDHDDGTGIAIESISVPPTLELCRYTAMLVENLEYSGVGTSQFFFEEETRETNFLEINPRFGATLALPYQCGFDFPLLALQMAMGVGMPATFEQAYQAGKRIHSFLEDVLASHRQAVLHSEGLRNKCGRILQVLRSWWNSNYHMTFEWSDPVPTLRLCVNAVGRGVSAYLCRVLAACHLSWLMADGR